ncbi:WD40 repeat-like protein [Polychaeton citri CBS 116435]|uniref:WD40 repeat-like protein n=1 Tax=Polychaeton citri CBS 116435 TaxID=1314669 RepID=A0A9P4UPB1_9PEZI|nr:WD40 repeat-like protein [Polychaeton citri CBS 116435]
MTQASQPRIFSLVYSCRYGITTSTQFRYGSPRCTAHAFSSRTDSSVAQMRLLQRTTDDSIRLTGPFSDNDIPEYAILSHRWEENPTQEVAFADIIKGRGNDKAGYAKIAFCAEQADSDGIQYFWVDTCCINQSSQGEHQKAINSMFCWYQRAKKCYVYLSDVAFNKRDRSNEGVESTWERSFQSSIWFTRGWTLQELLAPESVEFFSRDCKYLGDKSTLEKQICHITGIDTTYEEDKVYALLGIFDVNIPIQYGEGWANAHRRLQDGIDKQTSIIRDLRVTDPYDDKKRIEDTKGGLLWESYQWILKNGDFQQWRNIQDKQLLWIRGDPGKGKTMLLCGIIDELEKTMLQLSSLSYFFCQATDARINNATAVLRGLLYMLLSQKPSLVSEIQLYYERAGKTLFEDSNGWVFIADKFKNILERSSSRTTFLIIDALDECTHGLQELLVFIGNTLSLLPRVKLLVSSRNWPPIEDQLDQVRSLLPLRLELNAGSLSEAVHIFIKHKVGQLAREKSYDDMLREKVLRYLSSNANGTFLWAALVCQHLQTLRRWQVSSNLDNRHVPPGLDAFYKRMMGRIGGLDDAEVYQQILAAVAIVCRPITLEELVSITSLPGSITQNRQDLEEVIRLCGSFLIIRDATIYFVHQSAKDYLVDILDNGHHQNFPLRMEEIHHAVSSKSLDILSRTLRRNMYGLRLGYQSHEDIKVPNPDPIAGLQYPCVYWVNHFVEAYDKMKDRVVQDEDRVGKFIREKYLYWLEALALCKSISEGGKAVTADLANLVYDARRFIMSYKHGIEMDPLQTYGLALTLSPGASAVKRNFEREHPQFIAVGALVESQWSACLQTLEGHSDTVLSITFSPNSRLLASASSDRTVRIWNVSSSVCLQTLEGHNGRVTSVVFSPDSRLLASASWDRTIKIWDTSSGVCLQTLEGHSDAIHSVAFSPDSRLLASASGDCTVKIWDASSSVCLQTFEGYSVGLITSVAFSPRGVTSVAFSPNSRLLASASWDCTIKIWDVSSGACLQTLEGHSDGVTSVAFSPDSSLLASASASLLASASASWDRTVKIWDVSSGTCLQTLEGHSGRVTSVVFSPDSRLLVSASLDCTVRIWDASSSVCLQTLEGHSDGVASVAFSPDSKLLASTLGDRTVKIWDVSSSVCLQTLLAHSDGVTSVAFSPDSRLLASASRDHTVKIWDASSGARLQTLEGHSRGVTLVVFSPDSRLLASASWDRTVKIWDASSGACLQTLQRQSDLVCLQNIFDLQDRIIGLSEDKSWITQDSRRLLWIPFEHRPDNRYSYKRREGMVLQI